MNEAKQLTLLGSEAEQEPDLLSSYDIILANSSAGKDSQAMLDYLAELTEPLGIKERVVVVHADLGRAEWKGTRELAERQARFFGFKFEVVRHNRLDLLSRIEERGQFQDPARRWCTSDFKRAAVQKRITRFTSDVVIERSTEPERFATRPGEKVRILNCLGLRAEESPARAKKPRFQRDQRASNGKRSVDTWLPIQHWTEYQVWERVRRSGAPHHWAYDIGMPRLSCVLCIFAPKPALILAAKHNPDLLEEYIRIEKATGHKFKKDLSLTEIKEAVNRGEEIRPITAAWNM